MSLSRELAAKLGKPIRLLMSNSQGEAFAALCAIARLLQTHGCTFHDLADHVEDGGGLSDDDKKKIKSEIENARAIGYAEGVAAAEAKQHGHRRVPQHRRGDRVDRGRLVFAA